MTTTDPNDLLKKYLNENVLTMTRTGECIDGKLIGFDEYHSILLETENTFKFIRGDVLVFIGQKCE